VTPRQAVEALAGLAPEEARAVLGRLTDLEREALGGHWPAWAHGGQRPPEGEDWRVWVLLAGRGFGKTRAGAEWVSAFARENPGAAIALVAATAEEARAVMVEGRSGLLRVARAAEREAMLWEPSRRRLVFASGAEAFVYSAANPEGLRGPEHHLAWCDELGKWKRGEAAWDNLQLGLRLGERPRALVTTTPRGAAALRRILAAADTARTGGASRANPHVSPAALAGLEAEHGGTRFGRQELEGEMVEEVEGALWTRETLEGCRTGARRRGRSRWRYCSRPSGRGWRGGFRSWRTSSRRSRRGALRDGGAPTARTMSRHAMPPAWLRTSGGRPHLLMIWAMSELAVKPQRPQPRVRFL
jgi:phage terminase large subunit-like protein